MPKVSPEYVENKKQMIVDAAIMVCKRKTLSSLTMQDIIDESGLSQGGIYRFFSNIDEILIEVLNRVRTLPQEDLKAEKILQNYLVKLEEYRTQENTREIIQKRRELIKDVSKEVHMLLAESMKKNLFPTFKIEFEYNSMITNYPERAKMIYGGVKKPYAFYDMTNRLYHELQKEIEDGIIQPIVHVDELFGFCNVCYDGILKRAITRICYERNVMDHTKYEYHIDYRFHTMYLCVGNLLGL